MDYRELRMLAPAEQRLKETWLRCPERHLDQPCSESAVTDVMRCAFQSQEDLQLNRFEAVVAEQTFIPAGQDCAFVRHLRYMPAFWHRHEFFELLYILSGECDNIFEQETLPLAAGDLCVHAPGTVHTVRAFSDEAVAINILIRRSTFNRSFFGLMEEESILSSFFQNAFRQDAAIPYLLFRTGRDIQIQSLILEAWEVWNTTEKYRRPLLNAMLSELLIRVFQGYEDTITIPVPPAHAPRQESLMTILRYTQEHYATVTMQELSERFHYSPRQLQRLFQQATGSSFRDAIQVQRLEHSAKLLRTTDFSVQRVAEESGFQAVNNYRKLFQRRFGMMPSAYRREHQKEE